MVQQSGVSVVWGQVLWRGAACRSGACSSAADERPDQATQGSGEEYVI